MNLETERERERNYHWKPPDLADHRDLNFISESTELTKHHVTHVLDTHTPWRPCHLSSFSLSNQCVLPQLCRTLKHILSSKRPLNILDEISVEGDETLNKHMIHLSSLIGIQKKGFGSSNIWPSSEKSTRKNLKSYDLKQSKSNNIDTHKNLRNKKFNQPH